MTYQRKTKWKPQSIEHIKELYQEIVDWYSTYKSIWDSLGVSDNAVRKRFKTEGWELPQKNRPQIEFECDHCGKKFMREYNTLNDSRHGFHYCNKQCKDAGYKKQRQILHWCEK